MQQSVLDKDELKKLSIDEMRVLLCKWISNAWSDILTNHSELLKSSWKNCGLLCKLDDSEDASNFCNFL